MKLEILIEESMKILNLMEKEGADESSLEYTKSVYSALEELTQYKARYAELNKGFKDPETGELITGCTPYALERLKHKNWIAEQGNAKLLSQLEKIKTTFPLKEWDDFCPGEDESFCAFRDKFEPWIEENNIRPKDERYA